MTDAIRTGLSAIRAFQTQVDVTANNIANANSDGFKKTLVQMQEAPSAGGVQVSLSRDASPGPSLPPDGSQTLREGSNVDVATETISMMTAQRSYEANLKALKAAADMEKALVDLFK